MKKVISMFASTALVLTICLSGNVVFASSSVDMSEKIEVSSVAERTQAVLASSGVMEGMQPENIETVQVDDNNVIQLKTYNDDGVIITAVADDGKQDKEKVKEYLDDFVVASGDAQAAVFYNHTNCGTKTGTDSRNTNAQSTTSVNAKWSGAEWFPIRLDTTGHQSAFWAGSNPYNANKIILNQSYDINGTSLSVTLSWPPGASFNKDKSSGSWQSQPISNTYSASASHPNTTVTSNIAIYSCTYTDTADIYIGSTIYRPSSSVYLN